MAYQNLKLHPVQIKLSDLKSEGLEFIFSRESGELNAYLEDIIGKNPYQIKIRLKPAGNVYSAVGQVEAEMDLLCSLCAKDLKHLVKESFNEILILASEPSRLNQSTRVNHSSELDFEGPNCTELKAELFHIGEFIREIIAINEPVKPLGRPDCNSECEFYREAVQNGWLRPQDQESFKPESPFASLKGLKLNS